MTDIAGGDAPDSSVSGTISDRIAAFAMLDEMKDATQAQKCMRLSLVGFTAPEIAQMLQTSVPTVRQNLYSERKKVKSSENVKTTAKKPSSRTRRKGAGSSHG
jgi:DNA-directed RNA polymerase specialized sigma24 family protein